MHRLAVSIINLRRHEHLRLLLESLERNEGLDGVTFFLIQDGAVNPISRRKYANGEEIRTCLKVFERAELPLKRVVRQSHNVGIGSMIYTGYSIPFNEGFDCVVVLPNDMIAGKYYVKTMRTLFQQFEDDRKVGTIQTCPGGLREWTGWEQLEDKVSYGFRAKAGVGADQGTWRWCWDLCKENISIWHDKIMRYDYRDLLDSLRVYRNLQELFQKQRIPDLLHLQGKPLAMSNDFVTERWMERISAKIGCSGIYTLSPRLMHMGGAGSYHLSAEGAKRELGSLEDNMLSVGMEDLGNVDSYEMVETLPSMP